MSEEETDRLYSRAIQVESSNSAFILAHPIDENQGPVIMDISIILLLKDGLAEPIRVFDLEVTDILLSSSGLFVVDGDANMHLLRSGSWQDWMEVGEDVARINSLRLIRDQVFGVAGDGLIYHWNNQIWQPVTDETEDLRLYDLVEGASGSLYVSGESGFFARIEGRKLAAIELPTNSNVTSILLLPSGDFLLTGWRATALVGNEREMQVLEAEGRTLAFGRSVIWNDHVLIPAGNEILELKGEELVEYSKDDANVLTHQKGRLWKIHSGIAAEWVDGSWMEPDLTGAL